MVSKNLIALLTTSSLAFSCGVRKDSKPDAPTLSNTDTQGTDALPETTPAPTPTTPEGQAPLVNPSVPGTEVVPPVVVVDPGTVPPVVDPGTVPPVVVPPVVTPEPPVVVPVPALRFADVNEKIFKPFCVKCHTAPRGRGGVNLNSYEFVKTNLELIQNVVFVEKRMPPPPAAALEESASALLQKWIDEGAAE